MQLSQRLKHSTLSIYPSTGGMLRAIHMINEAKAHKQQSPDRMVVDLHPSRPDYRGFVIGEVPISMEADPTFEDIEAGASVERHAEPHNVLNDMFLVSGEIPRITPYEIGLRNGIRFNGSTESWEKDELIRDERLLMCNLKGMPLVDPRPKCWLTGAKAKESSFSLVAAMPASSTLQSMP